MSNSSIGHSQFERIPVSAERQERVLQKQLIEIEQAIQQAAYDRGQTFTVKQLEKTRKSLKLRLEKLRAEDRKDDVVTFEELGVVVFLLMKHMHIRTFSYLQKCAMLQDSLRRRLRNLLTCS